MPFTARDVLDEVIKVSESSPDFIYTEQSGYNPAMLCGYTGRNFGTSEGQPCIVGQALLNLGADRDTLATRGGAAFDVVSALASDGEEDVSSLFKLENIQENQDGGLTWAQAVYNVVG